MSTFTASLNLRRAGLAALTAVAAASLVTAQASAAQTTTSSSYGWPVKPFDRQHPVRGAFGDPRTVFVAPPTADGVLHGAGQFSFHEGIDISAPNGTAVYPVRDGRVVVASMEKGRERVIVASSDGVEFEYWHIAARVRVGESVTTDTTVLGAILKPAAHVH